MMRRGTLPAFFNANSCSTIAPTRTLSNWKVVSENTVCGESAASSGDETAAQKSRAMGRVRVGNRTSVSRCGREPWRLATGKRRFYVSLLRVEPDLRVTQAQVVDVPEVCE